MRYRLFIVIFIVTIPVMGNAQNKIVSAEDRSRFTFAQTYIGLSGQYLPSATLDWPDHPIATFPDFFQPRFLIGGPHFWGLVDFYISIPVSQPISLSGQDDPDDSFLSVGTMTGLKIYPGFRRKGSVSPFLGLNWSFLRADTDQNQVNGPRISKQRMAFEGGMTYTSNNWNVIELHLTYTPANTLNYYTDRTSQGVIDWPGWTAGLSYKKMFDFTRNTRPGTNLQKRPHLNGWHFGIGPSSSQSLKKAELLLEETPFMNNPVSWNVFPEVSTGYYLHKPDLDFRFAFRPLKSNASAYGVSQEVRRYSLGFEVYKNLFDYHGFVPFVGPTIVYDWYHFRQSGDDITQIDMRDSGLHTGLVFGWDIRPTRYNSWILRTNLRFYPTAGMSVDGYNFSMNQLELNFIQLVIFPKRFF